MSEAALLVIQGPDQGRRFDLGIEPLYLGRGGQNEVRILDTEVSRRHAVISLQDGAWKIEDLNSSNGTYVNGRLVSSALIQPGDQIQLGRTILLFTGGTRTRELSASERINLVARSPVEDRSRIVGQAQPLEAGTISGWAQAGANLQLLYQITEEAVRPTTSLDELLKRILDLTLKAVDADRGCMLVADSRTDRIEPRVVSHRSTVNVDERMPISTSIVEYVIQKGQGVRTADALHDSRFESGQSIMKSGIREAMCVPMRGRYELMGVIYVDITSPFVQAFLSENQPSRFNDQLLRLLLAIGRQSALAIENVRYQDALVTSERLAAVGQTVAIMSHHIKNILQGIRGGGYLIDMGIRDKNDELIRKGWGTVERNQERIYNLVMDMLTFSKEREPRLVLSAIEDVLEEVVDLMQSRLDAAGIQLVRTAVSAVPRSQFDPEGIHRAILNIVTNAIDALDGRTNPRIEIRYGFNRSDERIWVEIEDNGPGISQADVPRLFNLFESSKGGKGTGLGLAVSRKILQEHAGTISVHTKEGVGTCFRLEWAFIADEGDSVDSATIAPPA